MKKRHAAKLWFTYTRDRVAQERFTAIIMRQISAALEAGGNLEKAARI
jgi:hypothetical protein